MAGFRNGLEMDRQYILEKVCEHLGDKRRRWKLKVPKYNSGEEDKYRKPLGMEQTSILVNNINAPNWPAELDGRCNQQSTLLTAQESCDKIWGLRQLQGLPSNLC